MAAVLQDVNEFVEALQMGVSSSFNDNGLTPLPAKVQEAVGSSAQLRTIAEQAQGTELSERVRVWHDSPLRATLRPLTRTARAWDSHRRKGSGFSAVRAAYNWGNSRTAGVRDLPCRTDSRSQHTASTTRRKAV